MSAIILTQNLWRTVLGSTLGHVLLHQHTDQRAQQRPPLLSVLPHHARMGIKGRPESRVTPERCTGRAARRCLSWWVLPQEGISSTLRLPGGAGPSTGELVAPITSSRCEPALSFRFPWLGAAQASPGRGKRSDRTNPQRMPCRTPTNGFPHGRLSTCAGNQL